MEPSRTHFFGPADLAHLAAVSKAFQENVNYHDLHFNTADVPGPLVPLVETWPELDAGVRSALAARGGWDGKETIIGVTI